MTDPFQNGVYFLTEEFTPTGAFLLELTPPLKKERKAKMNKTCYRDRIARLTVPCPSLKNFNVKLFANADAATNIHANTNADAGGSTIALPGLRPGELKMASPESALIHLKYNKTLTIGTGMNRQTL